jgi:hypothetical protein
MEDKGAIRPRWRELNTDYWGTRLFGTGVVFMCAPVITVLFAEPIAILVIVYARAVMAALGMFLALSA